LHLVVQDILVVDLPSLEAAFLHPLGAVDLPSLEAEGLPSLEAEGLPSWEVVRP